MIKEAARSVRMCHLWQKVRGHISNAVIGGVILVITGFTPEHWVAHLLQSLHFPKTWFANWPSALDPRLLLVLVGISIIVGDTLWRRRRQAREATYHSAVASVEEPRRPLALPEKPSLAVLPFTNLSGEPNQEYLADGIVDDLITTLSQVSSLFVVARNSSFAFKGKESDAREIGQRLGVRYILEGSVRQAGEKLRVSAQLIDAVSGAHVWAERYDRHFRDIFAIQDELTKEIVTALRIRLTDGEQATLWLRSTNNVEAWGYATRGADHIWRGTAADMAEARSLLERAVACDPTYAKATALIAQTHYFDLRFNYTTSRAESLTKLEQYAARALSLDPQEPYAILVNGLLHSIHGRFNEALEAVERAVAKSPNDAFGWLCVARISVNAERPAEAEKAIRHAMRLNPFYPINYLAVLGDALIHQGKTTQALEVFKEIVARQPQYVSAHLHLARLYSSQGQMDAAGAEIAEVLRLDPKYRLAAAQTFYLSANKERKQAFMEDLRRAGLPE